MDLTWLMRGTTTSNAVQRPSRHIGACGREYERLFVRCEARRLAAEQLPGTLVVASHRTVSSDWQGSSTFLAFAIEFTNVNEMARARSRRTG